MTNESTASSAGLWIGIDGVEGAGKTTLAKRLADAFRASVAAEFSSSPIGVALRDAVETRGHYIMDDQVGQSLVFLADFLEVHKTEVRPNLDKGGLVISDRSWLSKYAYQYVTLLPEFGEEGACQLLDQVLLTVPWPDLTLRLQAPWSVLESRLVARDGACTAARLQFMKDAEEKAEQLVQSHRKERILRVDASKGVDGVAEEAARAIYMHLRVFPQVWPSGFP